MAKKGFDFKAVTKNLPGTIANTALVMGSMIASKKFLDPDVLMKDAKPDNMMVKSFPLIKLVLGLAGMAASNGMKQPGADMGLNLLGSISLGVALEGGITYARQLTAKKNPDGSMEYLYDAIGAVQDPNQTMAVGGVQDPQMTMAVGTTHGAVMGMGVQPIRSMGQEVSLDMDDITDDI